PGPVRWVIPWSLPAQADAADSAPASTPAAIPIVILFPLLAVLISHLDEKLMSPAVGPPGGRYQPKTESRGVSCRGAAAGPTLRTGKVQPGRRAAHGIRQTGGGR